MTPHQQDFVTTARQHARALYEAVQEMKAMQTEWAALDYGNTLPTLAESAAEEPPFEDANTQDGVGSAEIGAVLFATTDAILALFAAGHATNVAKLL